MQCYVCLNCLARIFCTKNHSNILKTTDQLTVAMKLIADFIVRVISKFLRFMNQCLAPTQAQLKENHHLLHYQNFKGAATNILSHKLFHFLSTFVLSPNNSFSDIVNQEAMKTLGDRTRPHSRVTCSGVQSVKH